MQKLAIAIAVLAMLTGTSVLAADMPVKALPPPKPPVYSWTGCYVGGNGGGSWSQFKAEFLSPIPGDAGEPKDSGFVGGGQAGCDLQFESIVIGGRGMLDWSSLQGQHTVPQFPGFIVENRLPWVDTVVGRIGFLIQPTSMLYVVGGAAWTREEWQAFFTGLGPKLLFEDANSNRNGWLIGGGYEGLIPLPSFWGLGTNLSWFVEYNYMDFGKKNVQFIRSPLFGGPFPDDLVKVQQTSHLVLFGLNYRFSFGARL